VHFENYGKNNLPKGIGKCC